MALRSLTRVVPVIALAPVWFCQTAAAQPRPVRTALAVHWSSEDYPSNPVVDGAIRQVLLSHDEAPVDYFSEYLESDRFPDEQATVAFRDYLQRKYQGRRIDVVLAITDPALQFVLQYREQLFPGVPIVASAASALGGHLAAAGVTGAAWRAADDETIELALSLHPSTQRVYVVVQELTDGYVQSVRAALAKSAERVELKFIQERSVPGLITAVRAVPPNSLIHFIRFSRQDPGNVMFPVEVVRLVAEASPVPVYVSTDSHVGTGVVGGMVRLAPGIGRRAGEMALQILDGARAQDIPIENLPAMPIFDWRQVQRWGIDASRLPPGSEIRFRVPTAWELYRWYIVGAISVVMMQTLLIAGLLVQRRKRNRAELALRVTSDRNRELADSLITAQEEERTRIARELHDDVGQRVASLSIALSGVKRRVHGDAALQRDVAQLQEQAVELSSELRQLSHDLHPGALEHLGLLDALRSRCDDLEESSGLRVQFDVADDWVEVPDAVALCFYRVAQEALRNVAQHAGARSVTVRLGRRQDRVFLWVVDDGIGLGNETARRHPGLGLRSLNERVRMLGGTLDLQSTPGAGTTLAVSVPIGDAHAA